MYSHHRLTVRQKRMDSLKTRLGLGLICLYIATNAYITSRLTLISLFVLTAIGAITLFGSMIRSAGISVSRLSWLLILFPLLYSRPLAYDAALMVLGVLFILLFSGAPNDIEAIFKIIVLIGLVNALSVFYQVSFPEQVARFASSHYSESQYEYFSRIAAKGYHSGINALVGDTAGYLCNALGVYFCWIISNTRRKIDTTSITSVIILLMALLYTGKKSHLIILILSILFISSIAGRGSEKVRRVSIFVLIGGLCSLLFACASDLFLQASTIERIIASFNSYTLGDDISSGRSILYYIAWDEFLSSPLLGIGWKSFLFNSVAKYGYVDPHYVNNDYLQVLCELGIIGFALTFVKMVRHYVKSCRYMKSMHRDKLNADPSAIRLITYSVFLQTFFLMYAFFENPYYNRSFLFMYFLSVAISYSIMKTNRSSGCVRRARIV